MTMVALRNGPGPIHLAWVDPDSYDTLCEKTIPKSAKVATWKAGKQATAIWNGWRRCPKCELEHEHRRATP
jgi:hypothetical protein